MPAMRPDEEGVGGTKCSVPAVERSSLHNQHMKGVSAAGGVRRPFRATRSPGPWEVASIGTFRDT